MDKLPISIEKLFKKGELSIDVTRLILNTLPVERVKNICGVNKYMHQQVCDDSFWALYYENMFLGPKQKFEERDIEKLKEEITYLFFYLLDHNEPKYAVIIYKKYKDYIDIAKANNYAIRWASKNGQTNVVELLLKDERVNPAADDNYAIQLASQNGHTEVVKLLLKDPRVNPAANENEAIGLASENGHTEIVKLLLKDPRVNSADDDNYAIRAASINGHVEVVKLLLSDPRVNFTVNHKKLMKLALKNDHYAVINVLLTDLKKRGILKD